MAETCNDPTINFKTYFREQKRSQQIIKTSWHLTVIWFCVHLNGPWYSHLHLTLVLWMHFPRHISLSNFYLIERHPKVDTGQVHDHGHGKTVSVWVEIGPQRHHHAAVYHVPAGKRSLFCFVFQKADAKDGIAVTLMCIYLTGGFFRRRI